jgi:uncharacterized membrane protein
MYLRWMLKKIGVRVVSFAALALLAAGLARILAPHLPDDLALRTGSEAVADLLGVLTSSMLAVTTFSLSIAVAAFATAAGSATPRATILLQEDRTTQNVLATFLGAFLFGLVGQIALRAQVYNASGKVVVFLFTVVVIGLVVVALIHWISHLMQFGRMDDTLDRVERAASNALRQRLANPFLGGQAPVAAPPERSILIPSPATGYVQHIDMQSLQTCAEKLDARLYVHRLPGAFATVGTPLLSVAAPPVEDIDAAALSRAFTIGTRRTFEDDPRFGLIVLTEIASRALSPGVNDPGTAIDILGRHVRILSQWSERREPEIHFERVFVSPIRLEDVMEDAFRPIARDGASLSEVQIRLHKALTSLRLCAPHVFADACGNMAREALERTATSSLSASEQAAIKAAAMPD